MVIICVGLYHGKDVCTVTKYTFSHKKVLKTLHPNAFMKRLWSDSLKVFLRFRVTTTALKAIDHVGGVDNYLLNLDDRSVNDSKNITLQRDRVAVTLYKAGQLDAKHIKRLGYDKVPPQMPVMNKRSTKKSQVKKVAKKRTPSPVTVTTVAVN